MARWNPCTNNTSVPITLFSLLIYLFFTPQGYFPSCALGLTATCFFGFLQIKFTSKGFASCEDVEKGHVVRASLCSCTTHFWCRLRWPPAPRGTMSPLGNMGHVVTGVSPAPGESLTHIQWWSLKGGILETGFWLFLIKAALLQGGDDVISHSDSFPRGRYSFKSERSDCLFRNFAL